ncbi:hypothetical protein RP20_CCG020527 [Aedes albopictus]|nr:hypothetical protein RP20_CCG020527 [Aedes albopictus]
MYRTSTRRLNNHNNHRVERVYHESQQRKAGSCKTSPSLDINDNNNNRKQLQ